MRVKVRANHQIPVFREAVNKASHRSFQGFVVGREHGHDRNACGDEPMKNQAGVFRRNDVGITCHNGTILPKTPVAKLATVTPQVSKTSAGRPFTNVTIGHERRQKDKTR